MPREVSWFKKDKENIVKKHRKRHKLLHGHLDELIADFIENEEGVLPSKTPILKLMEWSQKQTVEPSGKY